MPMSSLYYFNRILYSEGKMKYDEVYTSFKEYREMASVEIGERKLGVLVSMENGKSTAYMASLKLGEYTIPQILMMIVAGKIEYVSKIAASQTGLSVEECQMYFANLAYQCLFKDADAGQGLMNFFLLVFVDPTSDKFMGYNKGNKEEQRWKRQSNTSNITFITKLRLS